MLGRVKIPILGSGARLDGQTPEAQRTKSIGVESLGSGSYAASPHRLRGPRERSLLSQSEAEL